MFRQFCQGGKTYRQEALVTDLVSLEYDAHNASGDVGALKSLVKEKLPTATFLEHSATVRFLVEKKERSTAPKERPTMKFAVPASVLTSSMASKIAASGLSIDDLNLAHQPRLIKD